MSSSSTPLPPSALSTPQHKHTYFSVQQHPSAPSWLPSVVPGHDSSYQTRSPFLPVHPQVLWLVSESHCPIHSSHLCWGKFLCNKSSNPFILYSEPVPSNNEFFTTSLRLGRSLTRILFHSSRFLILQNCYRWKHPTVWLWSTPIYWHSLLVSPLPAPEQLSTLPSMSFWSLSLIPYYTCNDVSLYVLDPTVLCTASIHYYATLAFWSG